MSWTRRVFAVAGFLMIAMIPASPSAMASPEQEPVHVRILDPHPDLGDVLEREGFDVALSFGNRLELLAHAGDLARLVDLGIDFEIGSRDLFPGARSTLREGNLDPEYHTFEEMLAEITQLEADYPQICKLYDLGGAQSKTYTWGNYAHAYTIPALRISDNPGIEESEPCVVYDGRHHAREPLSTELVLAVAQHFCQSYGHIPSVTEAVDRTEIWIVPMVNPDGHQWVEDNEWWWRKNIYDYNGNHWVDDDEGIDPNRNYDWHWRSGCWESQSYGGPTPWSAPEVAAMGNLHRTHRTCLNATVHSFGEVILYPFGYGVEAEPAVIEIASELADRLGYESMQSTTANGTSKDWVYGRVGGCSFTVETGTEFVPAGPEMMQIVSDLLPGLVWLATRAHGPSIQGTVTSAATGQPLLATIRIPEIHDVYGNGELCDMQTEAATGYFCRLRPQESEGLTLKVSAPGHVSASVKISTGGRPEGTVVDIQLMPRRTDAVASGGTAEQAAMLGPNVPNPFNPHTALSYTLPQPGPATIKVYDPAGREVATLVDQWLAGGTHVVPWNGRDAAGRQVAPGVYVATLKVGTHQVSWRMVRLQ